MNTRRLVLDFALWGAICGYWHYATADIPAALIRGTTTFVVVRAYVLWFNAQYRPLYRRLVGLAGLVATCALFGFTTGSLFLALFAGALSFLLVLRLAAVLRPPIRVHVVRVE